MIAAGNYHADNRELITSISTWDIQDPMGYAAGDDNLYRYVFSNPCAFTDPSGNQAITSTSPGLSWKERLRGTRPDLHPSRLTA